jgi:hypothetical protein
MVDFLEKGLTHHVAEELGCQKDNADTATRLERAFLMADIHSHQAGVESSGATVALCLVKVSFVPYIRTNDTICYGTFRFISSRRRQ